MHYLMKQRAIYRRQAREYSSMGDFIRADVCKEHGEDLLMIADTIRLL